MIFPIVSAFSLAVILGFSFVSFILRKGGSNRAVTLLHAMLMASAVVLLWLYAMNSTPGFTESIVLVLVAFGSVGMLYSREFSVRQVPRWLVLAHGLFSIVGLVVLLLAEISRS